MNAGGAEAGDEAVQPDHFADRAGARFDALPGVVLGAGEPAARAPILAARADSGRRAVDEELGRGVAAD